MRNYIFIFVSIIFSTCSTVTEREQKSDYFPSKTVIIKHMDSVLSKSDLPALVSIAINKNGEQIEYTYGNAIWNEESPIRTNNIFRLASMTKLITSIAALQLVENDLLQLDNDLSLIMPEMASIPILTDEKTLVEAKNPITLRQLLTHTSGFGYFVTDSLLAEYDTTSNWNYTDLPRRFESGTKFLYGTSTDWVGKLVEKISGLNLEEYFRLNITGPLRMDRTWFNVPDSIKNEIVSYGGRGKDGLQPLSEYRNRIPKVDTRVYSGGGGLFSTPEDYMKLLKCLLNNGIYAHGQLLKKETIDQMFEKQLSEISMNIEKNYFRASFCCDFRGLIKPSANWGLAGLIDTENSSYGRKAGTLLWGGVYNTYFYIDRKSGVAASIYTQHLPFNHQATTKVFDDFSRFIYSNYK